MIGFKGGMLNNAIWYAGLSFLRPAISLILLPLYLNYLTPSDYGKLALIGAFSSFFVALANLKLDNAMRTFYFDFQDSPTKLKIYLQSILSASIMLTSLMLIVMLLSGQFIFEFFFSSREINFYPLGLLSVAAISLSQCTSSYFIYLQNQGRLAEFVKLRLLGITSIVVIQITLVMFYEMGIKGILLGSLFSALLVLAFVLYRNPQCLYTLPKWMQLTPSIKYSLPITILSIFMTFGHQVDKLVLERYLSLSDVGIYALLLTLFGIFTLVFNSVDNAFRPYIFNLLRQKNTEVLLPYFLSLYVAIALTALIAIFTLAMNLDLVVKNTQYLRIRDWLLPATLAFLPLCFIRFHALVYIYYKKSTSITIWTGIIVVVTFGLLLVLVPKFGLTGALGSIGIGHLLSSCLYVLHVRSNVAISLDVKAAASMLSLFVTVLWGIPNLLNLQFSGIYSLGVSLLYPVTIYWLYKNKFNLLFKLSLAGSPKQVGHA